MFPLTRPVRQALATAALVLLTMGPTVYVVSTAWRIHSPGHLREMEREIGQQLGVQVSLEGIRYPRPGEVLYQGVVLRQEEPRRKGLREIARATAVSVRRIDRDLLLEAHGLRLTGESPKLAMSQVGVLLQRPLSTSFERVSLTASACELDLGEEKLRYDFREVVATYQTDRSGPSLRGSYRLTSRGASASRAEFALNRDRTGETVRTTLALKTAEGPPLPARVLNPFFNAEEWLGVSARVEGSLTLFQTGGNEWEAEFQGDLLDVDFATLVGKRFPSHHLSGLAHVAIKKARWGERPGQGFGWVNASGGLTTRHGVMGMPLLRSLASEMKFRVSDEVLRTTSRSANVEFRSMGLTFAINRTGEIQLGGGLGNEYAPEVVLAGKAGPLVSRPQGTANVRGLIKTLFPVTSTNRGVLVPLTAESRVLLCLPTPTNLAPRSLDGN